MLVKGEMLTFVGSKPLLQSKHRLFPLNHPQQPPHSCFWPWHSHHLQDGESRNGNNLFCKESNFPSKFLHWDLNATIPVSAAVPVSPQSEVGGGGGCVCWSPFKQQQQPNCGNSIPLSWIEWLLEFKCERTVDFEITETQSQSMFNLLSFKRACYL